MWRLLVLLAAAVLAAADEAPAGGPLAGMRMAVEPRLGSMGIRIAVMEKHLHDLEHEIDDAAKVDPAGFVEAMHSRLDEIEGPVCADKHDVYCGRDSVECISSLMLCDGVVDCHNGWDEADSTCSPDQVKAGNVFSGTATWHRCLTRAPHPVQIHITGTYRPDFFRARMGVRANIGVDFIEEEGRHRTVDAKGYYIFGKKYLVLVPRYAHRAPEHLGFVCKFDLGSDEKASCHIVHEATLTECADFHAVLEH